MLDAAIRHTAGDFALDVAFDSPGGTLVIIGPSGAGKTLTLKAIAGVLSPGAARITLDGRILVDTASGVSMPSQLRRVGYVPQDYALFPHMTVEGNVGYGLRGLSGAARHARVDELIDLVGLAEQRKLRPRALSGGQRQRVALARALAVRPDILLLDEPFSAVDAPARQSLIEDVAGVLARTATPTVLVTHNRDEALRLGDRLAVLIAGRIRQLGSPAEIFSAPADEEVAAFVGVETIAEGRVETIADGLASVRVGDHTIEAGGEVTPGDPVLVCLRPEDVALGPRTEGTATSARNRLPATVRRIVPSGPWLRVEMDAGFPLVALITKQSLEDLALAPGSPVLATFKATAVHLIRK
ncbi:MAG: ABC transporter ATP-binding protein [Dehalococcoidia bacterium]